MFFCFIDKLTNIQQSCYILFIVNIHCVPRKVNGIFSNTNISVLLLLLFSISIREKFNYIVS